MDHRHDTHLDDAGTWTDRTLSASAAPDHRTHALLRQVFDLNTVFDITCRLHAVMDTNALLDGILMTAIGQLGVGAAAIVIQKPDEPDRLTHARWKGWTDVTAEEWTVDLNSPFAEALTDVCGPITYTDLRKHLDANANEARVLTRRECELVAPLQCRERLRGVLYTTGKMNGQPFTGGDFQFLRLIIEQFSVAIENAILYESERRYAEDLIQARERLLQHEKMATLGRLSAAIAHEINNPLGIIRNYIQLIREELADQPQSLHSLNLVSEEVERIARTVRQLLDAFRPGTGRPKAVDVAGVLSEVLEFLDPELRSHGVMVERTNLNDLPFTISRQDPLRQVFMNLSLNAQDAMPDGGTLRVSAEVDEDSVIVSFADEGTGIDDESLDRIFDPFYSTKGPQHGTGLGLAICRSILEGLGGSIGASNANPPRHGAIFRVTLPRVESIANGAATHSANNTDNRTTSKTGH